LILFAPISQLILNELEIIQYGKRLNTNEVMSIGRGSVIY
jgi:hypothetical protein